MLGHKLNDREDIISNRMMPRFTNQGMGGTLVVAQCFRTIEISVRVIHKIVC